MQENCARNCWNFIPLQLHTWKSASILSYSLNRVIEWCCIPTRKSITPPSIRHQILSSLHSLCAVSELCYEVSSSFWIVWEYSRTRDRQKEWTFLFQHLEMPNLHQLTAVLLAHSCAKCSGGGSADVFFVIYSVDRRQKRLLPTVDCEIVATGALVIMAWPALECVRNCWLIIQRC